MNRLIVALIVGAGGTALAGAPDPAPDGSPEQARGIVGSDSSIERRIPSIGERRIPPRGGTIAAEAVRRVLNQNRDAIQRCWQRYDLDRGGRIVVDFIIRRDGRVRAPRVARDSLRDIRVARCVLRVVGRWRFPRPQGGEVQVRYPFMFTPAASASPMTDATNDIAPNDDTAPNETMN